MNNSENQCDLLEGRINAVRDFETCNPEITGHTTTKQNLLGK
jgi:hypothetical protein